VQARWAKDNKIYRTMMQAFAPIESDFPDLLGKDKSLHLLKIIDMLEFLLHAQQEYRAGNRNSKVLDGLLYGGASLNRRLNTAQTTFSDDVKVLDLCSCIRYYYNRQVRDLGLNDAYLV
jgi:hypothetical protein